MVCQFLLYNKVNQLCIYIYPHISSLLRLPPTLPIPPLQRKINFYDLVGLEQVQLKVRGKFLVIAADALFPRPWECATSSSCRFLPSKRKRFQRGIFLTMKVIFDNYKNSEKADILYIGIKSFLYLYIKKAQQSGIMLQMFRYVSFQSFFLCIYMSICTGIFSFIGIILHLSTQHGCLSYQLIPISQQPTFHGCIVFNSGHVS